MKLAAANAIAGLVDEKDLSEDNILPEAFDPRVADVVSKAVMDHIRNKQDGAFLCLQNQ